MFVLASGIRASKSLQALVSKSTRGYYNIMRQANVEDGNTIPVYESTTFAGKNLEEIQQSDALTQYLKLVPFFLEKSLYDHPKQFVTSMKLHAGSKALCLECLTHEGVVKKTVNLENLIPVPYEDYVQYSRRKLFDAPLFLDTEMIFFNTFQNEFYVFDRNAVWHAKGVEHPLLDVANLYNEKAWFDALRII